MNNGEITTMEFKLRNYFGKLIFPDDSKDFIEGNIEKGEKIKISKSNISEIELSDGFKYRVIKDSLDTYIGYYVSQGEINVFESYPYGRSTFYGVAGPSTTINKTASLAHYEVTANEIISINTKKRLKELSSVCTELAEQLDINKDLKESDNAGEAFKFYNQACIDEPMEAPCILVVFRRKKGQAEDLAKVSINGQSYMFSINSVDTVKLRDYRNIELCPNNQTNCLQKVFNSNRFNYLEISKDKKDLSTKIEYVDKEYGEYYAYQIALKAKK